MHRTGKLDSLSFLAVIKQPGSYKAKITPQPLTSTIKKNLSEIVHVRLGPHIFR